MNAKPICKCEVILNNKSCVDARVGIRPLVRRESDNCGVYDSYYDYDAYIYDGEEGAYDDEMHFTRTWQQSRWLERLGCMPAECKSRSETISQFNISQMLIQIL